MSEQNEDRLQRIRVKAKENSARHEHGWLAVYGVDVEWLLAQAFALTEAQRERDEAQAELAEAQRANRDWLSDCEQEIAACTDWMLVADGIKHDVRCVNNAASGGTFHVCHRCRTEQAESTLTALRVQLQALEQAMRQDAREHEAAMYTHQTRKEGREKEDAFLRMDMTARFCSRLHLLLATLQPTPGSSCSQVVEPSAESTETPINQVGPPPTPEKG